MIYGICAIAFNVVMSYDCIMYALYVTGRVVVPPTNLFSFIFLFLTYFLFSVFPYIFQAKYVRNKKINEIKLVGGTTTWGTISVADLEGGVRPPKIRKAYVIQR